MTAVRSIELVADREPWLRQPREKDKAWVAFQAFLNMDPPRSVMRLAETDGRPLQMFYNWSSVNRWTERSIHYDGMLQRAADVALVEQRKEMNKRHAALAKAMSSKVAARIQTLQPEDLSAGELARWLQVIAMVERLALGESSGMAPDVQVNVGVNVDQHTEEVVFDIGHIGEVLDRLSARGIVPRPVIDVRPVGPDDPQADEVHPDDS
jgi:hypothetical protein